MRRFLRRPQLDFSDYLELRHMRDEGDATDASALLFAHLERALPVPFARAIPNMSTLADAAEPPPRELTRDAVRMAFLMRQEFARHGHARATMMGFDLPDGEGLKDWLDLVETERKSALEVRKLLRTVDAKIWRMFTGERRMPSVPPPLPRMLI